MLERIGIGFDVGGIYPVVWLMGQVVMTLSLTAMWTAAGEIYTTRQAKRLFPLFASAGIAGGVVGNAATGPLASLVGTGNLLLVQAGLLVAAAALAAGLSSRFFSPSSGPSRDSVLTDFRAGFDLTVSSPLLRMVAGVGVAFGTLLFLVVFPFSEIVTASFPSETEVASYLGYFSAVATGGTFLVSLLATNRLFARLGVVVTLMAVPLVYVGGFSLWFVSFGLVTATVVRGLQFVAVNAIGGTAWSSLFNVLAPRRRGQVMAFMAAGPMQLGTMISGGLLLAGGALSQQARTGVGLVVALATVALMARMRRAYGAALVDAVRKGLVDVFAPPSRGIQKPALDADTLGAMSACLQDPRPEARVMAMASLSRLDDEESSDLLRRALEDEDERVRIAGFDFLAKGSWHEHASSLLSDSSPEIRRRTLEMISQDGTMTVPDLNLVLADPVPSVRAAAGMAAGGAQGRAVIEGLLHSAQVEDIVAALTALGRRPDLSRADLVGFLDHPDRRVRAAAASAVAARPGHAAEVRKLLDDSSVVARRSTAQALTLSDEGVVTLLGVLQDGSVRSTDAALRALAAAGRGGAGLAEWASQEIARATYLKRHRRALEDGAGSSVMAGYLSWLLKTREERLERWAVVALTTPENEEAMQTVMRGLWSNDAETRAQAMEALDSLGDRAVVGDLLTLLEDETRWTTADPRASLRELATDHDEWIRALAYRCLRDELMEDVQQLTEAAALDSSRLVRDALSRWEPPIMQEIDTLDLVKRVLVLQRVALFSAIDPEDMERIALVVTERHYQAEELVFREGEESDEILLIVSGEVVVSRMRGDERVLIRTYGPGDHVGELAMLRGQPRASDVTAGPDGVHCLMLRAPEFQAILEERPEVAMAMLGTLAERLATM